MNDTMMAAVFVGDGAIDILERPKPRIVNTTDVLIEVENCGICGSDLAILGTPPRHDAATGTILGHEFSGFVREAGADVVDIRVGDRVVVAPNVWCGVCSLCRTGQTHHCANLMIHGVWRDGGLAPFVVVPDFACHRISLGVSPELAALAEPLSTVIRGLQRAKPFPGDTGVVLGGGPIGLMFAALLKSAGAAVVLVEPVADRAELAKQMGADAVVAPDSPELFDALAQLTGETGADIVVDAVGSLLNTSLTLVKRQGRVVLFGVNTSVTSPVQQFDITQREIDVVGAMVGTNTFPIAIRLIEWGTVDLRPLVTHRIPLRALPAALDELRRGTAIKVQVEFR